MKEEGAAEISTLPLPEEEQSETSFSWNHVDLSLYSSDPI